MSKCVATYVLMDNYRCHSSVESHPLLIVAKQCEFDSVRTRGYARLLSAIGLSGKRIPLRTDGLMYNQMMSYSYSVIQALRYLMRFQTEYTCGLLNVARHSAFGWEAAELVHSTRISEYIEEKMPDSKSNIEEYVWLINHKPWIPWSLLSVHVRMEDKAFEMKIEALEWGDCPGGDATPLVCRCCPLTTLGVNMISGTSICEDPISDSKEESIEYVNGEFAV
ncbi:hypothetical protein Tco_0994235 [Tanacetum coccineum]